MTRQPSGRRGWGLVGPGLLWTIAFFVVPLVVMARLQPGSTHRRPPGHRPRRSPTTGCSSTVPTSLPGALQLAGGAARSHRRSASCWPTRWPASWPTGCRRAGSGSGAGRGDAALLDLLRGALLQLAAGALERGGIVEPVLQSPWVSRWPGRLRQHPRRHGRRLRALLRHAADADHLRQPGADPEELPPGRRRPRRGPPSQTSWRVILPLALPGIMVGAFLTFVLCIGDYITPQILGGNRELLLPQAIMLQISAGVRISPWPRPWHGPDGGGDRSPTSSLRALAEDRAGVA